ncbi:hypothetical protein Pla123a_04680 [Posidoniimonas polymericola]|uniref:Uncharacterized protein n=1 Tax=Posidoniimonas polymericola TaxID=2528002 RepID=A0A5C5ZFP2_9BACT|nr:hypothetical protein [Posidoniimonas polymericola]TWT85661.1 hypothetical protein Pla123a_04680 [Posidoniimonas polymericola]
MHLLGIGLAAAVGMLFYHQEVEADGPSLHAALAEPQLGVAFLVFSLFGAALAYWLATAKVGDFGFARHWRAPSDTYLFPLVLVGLLFYQLLGFALGMAAVGVFHDRSSFWAAGGMSLVLAGLVVGIRRRRRMPKGWGWPLPWGLRQECRNGDSEGPADD